MIITLIITLLGLIAVYSIAFKNGYKQANDIFEEEIRYLKESVNPEDEIDISIWACDNWKKSKLAKFILEHQFKGIFGSKQEEKNTDIITTNTKINFKLCEIKKILRDTIVREYDCHIDIGTLGKAVWDYLEKEKNNAENM